jgi:hypothetical protein
VKRDSQGTYLSLNDAGMRSVDLVGVPLLDFGSSRQPHLIGEARCSFDASLLEAHTKTRRFWLAGVGNL